MCEGRGLTTTSALKFYEKEIPEWSFISKVVVIVVKKLLVIKWMVINTKLY
jgi:hypothetical protein